MTRNNGIRFAVRHQIPADAGGMVGGLYTDGPVYPTRLEAEAECERLDQSCPTHHHYVVEHNDAER